MWLALIIDDDPLSQENLSAILKSAGAVTTQALTSADAMAALRGARFDLVLLKTKMPAKTGYEMVAAIRKGRGPNATTLILGLAQDKGDKFTTCRAAGMTSAIRAPVTKASLIRATNALGFGATSLEDMKSKVALMDALSNQHRAEVLGAVVIRVETNATAVATDLGISRQAAAMHLGELVKTKLVSKRGRGSQVRYFAQSERFDEIAAWMTELANRTRGREQRLASPATSIQ